MIAESWKEFHNDFYLTYADLIFSQEKTQLEIEAINKVMSNKGNLRILDLGCGYGRHSIPLALQGHNILGIDGSKHMIKEAKRRSSSLLEQEIEFELGNISDLNYSCKFDLVLNLGTAFSLILDDYENQRILHKIHEALKPNGTFMLELGTREPIIREGFGKYWSKVNGNDVFVDRKFDVEKSIFTEKLSWLADGKRKRTTLSRRLYTATELINMLQHANFSILNIYNGFELGKLEVTSEQMLFICQKI